jgi:hypothetical protein
VNALTLLLHMDRPLETPKKLARPTARHTLTALLIYGALAETGISSPAQTSQPDYKQQPTPPTESFQIDRRRIGLVILAACGPTGRNFARH